MRKYGENLRYALTGKARFEMRNGAMPRETHTLQRYWPLMQPRADASMGTGS